jgi:hypothetical protein
MAARLREAEDVVPYELVIKPLAWLKVYGVTDSTQIERIRKRIIREVYAGEAKLARERLKQGRGILGAQRLRHQEYWHHTRQRRGREISFLYAVTTCLDRLSSESFKIYSPHVVHLIWLSR